MVTNYEGHMAVFISFLGLYGYRNVNMANKAMLLAVCALGLYFHLWNSKQRYDEAELQFI